MFERVLNLFRTPAHAVTECEWARRIAKALHRNELPVIVEQRLSDGTRIDLSLSSTAVEMDWAPKWAEAIGQALYYGIRSQKKSCCLLLVESACDEVHVKRCRLVARNNTPPLLVWTFDTRKKVLDMDGRLIEVA